MNNTNSDKDLLLGDDGDLDLADPLDFGSNENDGPLFGDGIDFSDDGLDFDNVDLSGDAEESIPGLGAAEQEDVPPRTSTQDIVFDDGAEAATPATAPAPAPVQSPEPLQTPVQPQQMPAISDVEHASGHLAPVAMSAAAVPAKKPLDTTMILGIVAAVMVLGAIVLVVASGPKTSGAVVEEVSEEPTYRTPAIEIVNVRTSPPALRILVDGHSKGSSPLELKIRENEFPVTITARFNQSTELERVLTGPEDEIFFDFSDLIK